MKAKVVKINHGVPKGTIIPMKQDSGNIGKYVEGCLEDNGHVLNKGKGVDIPNLNLEVKTRKIESKSAHTIGTESIENIKSLSYSETVVYEKFQQQYRVTYSDTDSVVVDSKIVDFSDPIIQKEIEEGYDFIRSEILRGNRGTYISGNTCIYAEITKSGKSYRFRVPNGSMKKLLEIASTFGNRKKHFEQVDA